MLIQDLFNNKLLSANDIDAARQLVVLQMAQRTDLAPLKVHLARHAVTRHARLVEHDRDAFARDPVEKRGLAHVGATDYGDCCHIFPAACQEAAAPFISARVTLPS